jgi:hypothetical protein
MKRMQPRRLRVLFMVAALCGPTLVWGQTGPRVPIELKLKLADGKIGIGKTFVEALKNRIKGSETLVLSDSDIPRLVLRIASEDLPGDPYLAVIAVTRTVALAGKGGPREIFLDDLLMVGVSGAHAGKDAADMVEDTLQKILPKFIAIKSEGN